MEDIFYNVFHYCDFQTLFMCMKVQRLWYDVVSRMLDKSLVGTFQRSRERLKKQRNLKKNFKIIGTVIDYFFVRIGVLLVVTFCHDGTDGSDFICINVVDCFGSVYLKKFLCDYGQSDKLTVTFFENYAQSHFLIVVDQRYFNNLAIQLDLDNFDCFKTNLKMNILFWRQLTRINNIAFDLPDQKLTYQFVKENIHPNIYFLQGLCKTSLKFSIHFQHLSQELIFQNTNISYDNQCVSFRCTWDVTGMTSFVLMKKQEEVMIVDHTAYLQQKKAHFFMMYCNWTKSYRLVRIRNLDNKRNIKFSIY